MDKFRAKCLPVKWLSPTRSFEQNREIFSILLKGRSFQWISPLWIPVWADLKGTSLFNTTEKHFLLQVSSYLSYRRYLEEEKTLLGWLRDTSTHLSINFLSCSCKVFLDLPSYLAIVSPLILSCTLSLQVWDFCMETSCKNAVTQSQR